jgi:hypothetical protein
MSGAESTAPAAIDFESWFPHKGWLSSWAKDELYPQGFRYKLLAMRPEPRGLIEMLLVLEDATGSHKEEARVHATVHALDSRAATFTEGLGKHYGIEFTAFDLSQVRTESELIDRLNAVGWYERPSAA